MKRVLSITTILFLILSYGPLSAQEEEIAPSSPKEWTVAVFLNADNNLDPFGVEDQQEMAKVGSNDWLNLVTLIDRENGPACYNYIEKGNVKKVKDMGELDMGDYKLLVNFMKYIVANYPAKKYVLTIWNHGSGWKHASKGIVRGISYDDSSNNHITTGQLGTALKEIKKVIGHNIDILNFDACLMQMAEVAYVCQGSVDYIVASEETEPGKGTPYDDVFSKLTKSSTPVSFSKAWVKAFVGSYSGGSQGNEDCTQSALDVAKVAGLVDAINGFAKASMGGKFAKEFKSALQKVQTYSYPENCDLMHLASLILAQVNDEGMKTACQKVISAGQALVIANGSSGTAMKDSKGIAIYLPSDYSMESPYTNLDFCKGTMWDEMITDLGKKTLADNIVTDVENGDLTRLRDFISRAADFSPEVRSFVISEINFRLHSESGINESVKQEIADLLKGITIR